MKSFGICKAINLHQDDLSNFSARDVNKSCIALNENLQIPRNKSFVTHYKLARYIKLNNYDKVDLF